MQFLDLVYKGDYWSGQDELWYIIDYFKFFIVKLVISCEKDVLNKLINFCGIDIFVNSNLVVYYWDLYFVSYFKSFEEVGQGFKIICGIFQWLKNDIV